MAARRGKNDGESGDAAAKGRAGTKAENHREFVSEAEEILERMFEDLSDLGECRHQDREVDPDLVNRIFRSAHSLKGLAGMFGMDGISDLAHHLEDILDGMRLGRISLGSQVVDLLDDGVALLGAMMANVEGGASGEERSEMDASVAHLIEQIETAIRSPAEAVGDDLESLGLDPSILRALTEYEEHRLRENVRRGRCIALVDSTFEIAVFEEGLNEISEAVREVGEVISTLPSQGNAPASQICFSLLVATELSTEELNARVNVANTEIRGIGASDPGEGDDSIGAVEDFSGDDRAPAANIPETPAVATAQAFDENGPDADAPPMPTTPATATTATTPGAGDASDVGSLRSLSDTVRVDIRKLDQLMTLVGELVIARNAIGDFVGQLNNDPSTVRLGAELAKTHQVMARKLGELQSGVLDVRMVPMRQVFEKLSRVVRRLRRDLAKEVNLEVTGADTELDKLIVEELIDPLVHLVRNAFDHAIESTQERQSAGKPMTGTITVRAMQRGNHVVVEVEDDGRGMNPDAILAKGIERGMIAEGQNINQRDLLNLVFEPGFSTCDEVTATSGRGVGMDVVRSNLARLGGTVELASVAGRGMTVTVTLPITLAIMQALIVEVETEQFAIPLASVLETLVVEPGEIGRSEGREILNLRGAPLRLSRLGEELEIAPTDHSTRQFAVVIGIGDQRIGLLVDRLAGQQDAVIKPIKGPITAIHGIAGAAELGGRNAVLVIDVSAMMGDGARRREAA